MRPGIGGTVKVTRGVVLVKIEDGGVEYRVQARKFQAIPDGVVRSGGGVCAPRCPRDNVGFLFLMQLGTLWKEHRTGNTDVLSYRSHPQMQDYPREREETSISTCDSSRQGLQPEVSRAPEGRHWKLKNPTKERPVVIIACGERVNIDRTGSLQFIVIVERITVPPD